MKQIQQMFKERFPFCNIEKLLNYPFKLEKPNFPEDNPVSIKEQSNERNCVVSNLFATFLTMDQADDLIEGKTVDFDEKSTKHIERCSTVREYIKEQYALYKSDFSPFTPTSSYTDLWEPSSCKESEVVDI